ncbi:MAG: mechanosensitive ion channel family protein [Bacteroidales bacterium]|nr:mechanosensitive ion channel family protein [Bacteroidales bacterium]
MSDDMATFFNRLTKGKRREILRNILLLIPGIAADFVIHSGIIQKKYLHDLFGKLTVVYLIMIGLLVANSLLTAFLEIYSKSEKNRNHPLKALVQGMQVVLFFVGGIVMVGVLIDKSPTALLTGLGASAAVLMLIFKDSILGFVAGVQLTQNNMVRLGDWIQMPDGSANGTVEEITLNTVKVRNWDNTITMIPPYTLVSSPFKNWRGMTESGGRRVDKMIRLDMDSLEIMTPDMTADLKKSVPLMRDYTPSEGEHPTNSQLYRIYIEKYLRSHPVVAQNLDLIIAQREPSEFGLPIEVYFFLTDKVWNEYEKIQSDIFDHLLSMASEFGLKLYQLSC